MVTLTWWILKKNCESCKRAAFVLQKGCLWSCKRATSLTLLYYLYCALEKEAAVSATTHAGHMAVKNLSSKPTRSAPSQPIRSY